MRVLNRRNNTVSFNLPAGPPPPPPPPPVPGLTANALFVSYASWVYPGSNGFVWLQQGVPQKAPSFVGAPLVVVPQPQPFAGSVVMAQRIPAPAVAAPVVLQNLVVCPAVILGAGFVAFSSGVPVAPPPPPALALQNLVAIPPLAPEWLE